jgi:DNA polymerase III delta subunit
MAQLFAVSGNQNLLRRRYYQETLDRYYKDCYRLDFVNGEDSEGVRAVLSGGLLFTDNVKSLVVVSNPEEVDLDIWMKHLKDGDDDKVVLLYYEGIPKGNTKFGKFLAGLKKNHISFEVSEKFWEQEPAAIKFCVSEFKKYNKECDEKLAISLVTNLGPDFGFLSFEVQKISMLADIAKTNIITLEHIKGGISLTPQVLVSTVLDSLVLKNRKKMSLALEKVRKATKDDPTLMLCRLIEASAFKWLSVIDMRKNGTPLEEGASQIGVNPWFLQNKLAPQVANWNWDDITKLLRILANSERAVLSGQLDPWRFFCSQILDFCGF